MMCSPDLIMMWIVVLDLSVAQKQTHIHADAARAGEFFSLLHHFFYCVAVQEASVTRLLHDLQQHSLPNTPSTVQYYKFRGHSDVCTNCLSVHNEQYIHPLLNAIYDSCTAVEPLWSRTPPPHAFGNETLV